jgi:hypothetical protein
MDLLSLAFASILVITLVHQWRASLEAKRADFIRKYTLPAGLFAKLQQKRPTLSLKDCQLVGHALRQFFLAYLRGGPNEVAMPSQVVDDLWHELILYTREYQLFCRHAFGRFMHHAPAVVMGTKRDNNEALRRCWWFACFEENIDPRRPTRLPLLFALDRKLNIEDGFVYATDCRQIQNREKYGAGTRAIHCATDFGDKNFDGSLAGFGRSRDSGSCGGGGSCSGGGHGHGCSGGCSGGCGGH